MKASVVTWRSRLAIVAAAVLAACSSTDRSVTPITGLKSAPDTPRNATITNGSIGVCKNAGPAGTYHFHVDVIGGGPYVLTPGADFTITFDGADMSCVSDIYKTVPPWAPGVTAIVKISEVLLPPGVTVDSINATDRFGTIETSVIGGGTIIINEEVLGIHSANFFNAALPSVTCLAINAVQGVPITPTQLTGTGGSGGPYTFTATGLPAGLSISSSGLITGTPTVTGNFNYQVTVTDKDGHQGTSGSCAVTVNGPPSANCVAITAVAGVPITPVTMIGSGGTGGPYTFSAVGLPNGLTMSAGGTISGTPTVTGAFNYTVTVTDKDGHSGSVNCSVTVTSGGKPFSFGPNSMEGHLTITAGTWFNGGYSFKFKSNTHVATQFTVTSRLEIVVTCPNGGGAGGTIIIPMGTVTYNVPAGNTDWLPTGDQNSILSWMGAIQTPNLCNGFPMDNAKGASFFSTVSQSPATGSLVDFRFKYRNPAAKGKTDTNCTDPLAPKRNDAATCGASWSSTKTDP